MEELSKAIVYNFEVVHRTVMAPHVYRQIVVAVQLLASVVLVDILLRRLEEHKDCLVVRVSVVHSC